MDTNQLLEERGNTHGEFADNSRIAQCIKRTIREGRNWEALPSFACEALDMIAHKIGRLLEGKWNHEDHWDDILGYAKLAADRIRQGNEVKI